MPDFKETRDRLQQARNQKEEARRQLFEAQQRLKKVETEQSDLNRIFTPNNQDHIARRESLSEAHTEAQNTVKERGTALNRFTELERGRFTEFAPFTDPRRQIERFSDQFPFLLLPVRIETRFKTVNSDGITRRQLWVRVYPDDCAVDSFEAELTETEVAGTRNYWAAVWSADGSEDLHRAAWRSLVASHGEGRAAWLVQSYLPLNAESQPKKANPQDIILVIVTDQPLAEDEQNAVKTFWHSLWLADQDQAAQKTAREVLQIAVGDERAAQLIADYQPINFDETPEAPLKKTDVIAQVVSVVFRPLAATATKTQSWSQAPKVNVMPDRFVLVGYSGNTVAFEIIGQPVPSPLIVGLNPSAAAANQIQQKDGEIIVPEEIEWMMDFERAVTVGMGFKINLTDVQASEGFDRLLALGIRLSADQKAGQVLLEDLFEHHRYSRNQLSLLPQGTPTNNTESADSGFTRSTDIDASFDDNFKPAREDFIVKTEEWAKKRDGQWLAEYLGINPKVFEKIRHSGGTDQREARAMNVALYPATLGYTMETMMQPVFDDETVEQTRWFFNNFVSGRGAIPAIRIGSQPYGILPATAFSRMRWIESDQLPPVAGLEHPRNHRIFMQQLNGVLGKMSADWAQLSKAVSFVGKPPEPNNDAHKILLDILGLHSGSVEFHQRYAESLDHIFNVLNLGGFGGALMSALIAAGYVQSGKDLLNRLGYTGEATPDVLNKFFMTAQHLLKGPVVDDRPLSEIEAIRKYTDETDENKRRNYIEWLIDSARSSLETIRQQKGFKNNQAPNALLYLMLRHSLILGYWDTSLRLHREADIELSTGIRREPTFIHVREQAESSESRWNFLYKTDERITNNRSLLVADYIPQTLFRLPAARYLSEQISALEILRDAPTARLERLFAEHVDCCSYRLDAWRMGLVNYQLAAMRYRRGGNEIPDNEISTRKGIYLGAYGWLEEVRPENKVLTPVTLNPTLDKIFNKPGQPPLERDDTNAGYIHAPSLNHAVTAAVLRNGYISNAAPANPKTLAVNLSSARVRRALAILEGVRGGQSLSALLGYQFERGLHDSHNQAEVDQFILSLRKAFPLRANHIIKTKKEDDNISIEAIEARNVLDGVKLVEHIKKTGNQNYPFGKILPAASAAQAAAINAEVERLFDTHDAIADLGLAEGVHQAVQGNYDRAASMLETYGKGNFPPEPEVVQTPRSGTTLTHRIGLQFEAGLAPMGNGTPRSQAEPALNQWLASILPALSDVFCQVEYFDHTAAAQVNRNVALQDLQLQPIDVIYLLRTENEQAMSELDDRILRHAVNTFAVRPDAEIKIKYIGKPAGKISLFELAPLVTSLRSLVLRSRPLRASDIALQTESRQEQDETVFADQSRIITVKDELAILRADLTDFIAVPPPTIDETITAMVELLSRAGSFNIAQTGWGLLYDWRRQMFGGALGKVRELTDRWTGNLSKHDVLILDYDNLPVTATDEEKFDLLQRAERLVSTQPIAPLPALPDNFKAVIVGKRLTFEARLNDFKTTVLAATGNSLTALVNEIKVMPTADLDFVSIDLTEIEKQITLFSDELNSRAQSVAAESDKRIKAAQAALDAHDAASTATERVRLLEQAAKILLGDDFRIIPEFSLMPGQADEWEKVLEASTSGELLRHQMVTFEADFPVDDWLYGLARVREKLQHWERIVMLTRAFDKAEPELLPVQFPFKPDDHWLGLEFPADHKIDGDRLLYTAHYAAPFQKTQRQCGLLLDEWTEVIPGAEETTGITFHYDRPNSEPPQVMLLVTPTTFDGSWQWRDLVDALNETLELAKHRAVEPVQVDPTAYARFLPATVMAVTLYQISIAANLGLNNNVSTFIQQRTNNG